MGTFRTTGPNPLTILMIVSLFALSLTSAAQTIVNGSFEAVQIAPGSSGITNIADVPGWTHSGSTGDGFLWHTGPVCCGGTSSTAAPDGLQFVTLGGGFGPSASSAWSQTITGLNAGSTYDISFQIAAEGETATQVITVGMTSGSPTGSQIFTTPTTASLFWLNWGTFHYDFVASDSSATLQFSVTNEPLDVGLDDVRISEQSIATPEPGSLLLLGTGALAGTRRFWKKN